MSPIMQLKLKRLSPSLSRRREQQQQPEARRTASSAPPFVTPPSVAENGATMGVSQSKSGNSSLASDRGSGAQKPLRSSALQAPTVAIQKETRVLSPPEGGESSSTRSQAPLGKRREANGDHQEEKSSKDQSLLESSRQDLLAMTRIREHVAAEGNFTETVVRFEVCALYSTIIGCTEVQRH